MPNFNPHSWHILSHRVQPYLPLPVPLDGTGYLCISHQWVMCSQTLIQDYPNRGNHVIQNNSHPNQQSRHSSGALMAAQSPINTMAGDSNIYMEPSFVSSNYQSGRVDSRNDCHQLYHGHNGLPNGNPVLLVANGSAPSSPLSTLSPPTSPSTNGPSLPPYLTDSLSSNRPFNGNPQHLHPYGSPNETQLPQTYFHELLIHSTQEFLPLCDLLFNIISLAAYFCDLVFDSVTAYTLYLQRDSFWLSVTLSLILLSSLISQILSYRWYSRRIKAKESNDEVECQSYCVLTLHVFMCGVLWRYFKLFIPVDLSSVKHEVRDLCVLRMVHAFCEAAPMLIIQVYLLWLKTSVDQITDLNIISIFLSLFNLCWALASFSKNVRSHNIHKLVLTWLGVIFQFFWRLGTISSRVVALTAYATIYSYWVFAVIVLHWFSMLLWLLSPKNLFYGEKMSSLKRFCYSCLIAWIYIFCYINMQEDNSKNRMIAFYSTMFLENTLLLSICLMLNTSASTSLQSILIVVVLGGFALGMLFMILYYKFFHIRHLKHTILASNYDQIEYPSGHCPEHGNQYINGLDHMNRVSCLSNDRILQVPLMNPTANGVISGIPGVFNCRLNPALKRKKKKPSSFVPPPVPHISANASNAVNTITSNISSNNNLGSLQSNTSASKLSKGSALPVPSPTAFWKKSETANGFLHSQSLSPTNTSSPLTLPAKHPFTASIAPSPVANFTLDLHHQLIGTNIAAPVPTKQTMIPNIPNITPVPTQRQSLVPKINRRTPEPNSTTKVNIQQKLQEKKQQQFMQLKKIEEEIKQGIISKPHMMDRIESPPLINKSVAPQAKKQPHLAQNNTSVTTNAPFVPLGNRGIHHYYYHPVYRRMKLRSQTPEVLLAPHYLDNSRVFYDYPSCVLPPTQSRLLKVPLENSAEEEEEKGDNNIMKEQTIKSKLNLKKKKNIKNSLNKEIKVYNNSNNNMNKTNRFSSDMDSQVSLPRSYTLPREFQYCRSGHNGLLNGMTDQNNYLKSSRIRKPLSTDQFHPNVDSDSSNDGDVDSDCFQTDINPDDFDITAVPKIIRGPVANMRTPGNVRTNVRSPRDFSHRRYKRHETPL